MKENTYKTKDLSQAAALVANRQTLIRIDREGSICWFIFDNKKICEQLVNQFIFNNLTVSAREYYESLVRLKTIIFSSR